MRVSAARAAGVTTRRAILIEMAPRAVVTAANETPTRAIAAVRAPVDTPWPPSAAARLIPFIEASL
jgi:hypothetical protein